MLQCTPTQHNNNKKRKKKNKILEMKSIINQNFKTEKKNLNKTEVGSQGENLQEIGYR
jgi:hypothetical protein